MNTIPGRAASSFQYQLSNAALVAVLAGAGLAILMFGIGMAAAQPGIVYASMALLAFIMPATAGLLRGSSYDLFEPINLVAGAVFFATTLRAFYVLTSDSTIVEFNMWGTDFGSVNGDVPWMLAGMAALVAGYLLVPTRLPLERLSMVRDFTIGRQRLWLSIALSAAAGLVGVALFIQMFGIDLSGNLLSQSFKRVVAFEGEGGETVYGVGLPTFLGRFTQFGFLLLGAVLMARLVRVQPVIIAILGGLFFLSAFVPFLSSSRSTIVLMLINLCIIGYYYGRIQLKSILLAMTLGIALVAGMGFLRELNQRDEIQTGSVLDATLGAGNGIDFIRTSAIMDRVPEVRPYQNGLTYAALFSAVIPRAVWPDKPETSLGTYVKGELFGERVRKHGWPPGMIAEAYMNFGLVGIIPVMMLFGGMLRIFYESCRPLLGVSLVVTVIYSVSIWRLAFGSIGLNFALGIIQVLQLAVPMLLFLWLAKAPRPRRGAASAYASPPFGSPGRGTGS